MAYTVAYKSRLGRVGRVKVDRPEDAKRVVTLIVRSWDERDRPVEMRFVDSRATDRARKSMRKRG